MEPVHQRLTHFAGFDWASDHHDIIVLDAHGKMVADFKIEHSAAGWRLWREKIAAYPQLGIAIETSFGMIVEQLIDSGVAVYPVNPMSARRCRDEVALIEERTALINQLRQALREYYPTALEAFEDWASTNAWSFIEHFTSTDALIKAGKRRWEKFLHSHRLGRPESYEARMAAFAKAGEWTLSSSIVKAKSLYAVAKVKQLRTLDAQLDEYRRRIEALFASHPDSGMFGSLPGAGPKLAPRLLSEIGSDRSLFDDAQGLQCIAGTAPVSYQSGKIAKVQMRRSCNRNLRHTMHMLADKSREKCTWASIYYDELRKRGRSHAQTLRSLGQRWLKIIWKMWQTSACYDAELHMKNQLNHGSWVLKNPTFLTLSSNAKNFLKKAGCNR